MMIKMRKRKCNEIIRGQERLAADDTGMSDRFEKEAVKMRRKGRVREREKKTEKGCILFIHYSGDLEGVQGPQVFIYIGTSPCALSS